MDPKNPFCQLGQLCDHQRVKFTLPKQDGGLRKCGSFPVKNFARRFCVFANTIWLPCFQDNCIQIYNFEGELLREIKTTKIRSAHALSEYNRECLLVAAENGLFLLDRPNTDLHVFNDTLNGGHHVTLVRQGSFCDVFVNFPYAVALDYKIGVAYVTIFRKNYGRITEMTTRVKLNFETDFYDTAVVQNDESLFVSSCVENKIFKLNKNGVRLAEYGQKSRTDMVSDIDYLSLCGAVSTSGALVVADAMNDCVMALDPDTGKWIYLYEDVVKYPLDAVLGNDNDLFVLSGKLGDIKIYRFQMRSSDSKTTTRK